MAHNKKRQGQNATLTNHQKTRDQTPPPTFSTLVSGGPRTDVVEALQDLREAVVVAQRALRVQHLRSKAVVAARPDWARKG